MAPVSRPAVRAWRKFSSNCATFISKETLYSSGRHREQTTKPNFSPRRHEVHEDSLRKTKNGKSAYRHENKNSTLASGYPCDLCTIVWTVITFGFLRDLRIFVLRG